MVLLCFEPPVFRSVFLLCAVGSGVGIEELENPRTLIAEGRDFVGEQEWATREMCFAD